MPFSTSTRTPNPKHSNKPISKNRFLQQHIFRWNRLIHRWVAITIAIPIIFVTITGLFLQVRGPVNWIQPSIARGSQQYEPTIGLEQVLRQVKAVPEMQVNDWSDIKLLDLLPEKGIIKVRNYVELEMQVDASTGEVLQTAQRRNDLILRMHDFSAWNARLWLGVPIGLGFLAILLTGVYLSIKKLPARLKAFHIGQALQTHTNKQAVHESVPVDKDSKDFPKDLKDGRPRRLRLKTWMLKHHYWLGLIVMIPWAFVITSGLLLQVRYEVPWMMPIQQQGQGSVPTVEFAKVLETARQLPEYGVQTWEDVSHVDVRPNEGATTLRAKNRQELQLDSSTAEVLQVATRRTDWLKLIHEGKWMGLNLWLFLPMHIVSLALWLTGTIVAYSR